jgi:hypothetical protein
MLKKILPCFILILFITAGCSSSSPVVNTEKLPLETILGVSGPIVVKTSEDTYRGILGAYMVIVDKENLTAELMPVRQVDAIGDVYDSHITEFLVKTSRPNCIKITNIALTDSNNVSLSFAIRHPFDNLQARPDLHVFDVRGIVLVPGGVSFSQVVSDVDGDGVASEIIQTNPNFLVNADGYTTHFDDQTLGEFFYPPLDYAGNLNPYRNFFVDPVAGAFDPFQPSGHGVMPVNSDYDTQPYIFNPPEGSTMQFMFIVDAVYGQSANRFNRHDPQYYLPEFNRKEAWSVTTELILDTLEAEKPTSSAYIRIKVKDWQAMRNRDPNYPDQNNPTGISEKSDVKQVEISCPDFGLFQVKTKLEAEVGGNGSDAQPYEFNFGPIEAGVKPAGIYYGLVAVRDDLEGLGGPLPIRHKEGETYPSNGPDITDYTTYQIIPIRIRETGSFGCPAVPEDFFGCTFTDAFGIVDNESHTLPIFNTSPHNMLDIDYGVWGIGIHKFVIEKGQALGAVWTTGTGVYTPLTSTGAPNSRVGSIDIDNHNRLVFSKSGKESSSGVVTVTDRNFWATDTFSIWDVNAWPAVSIKEDIGLSTSAKIIAIETDLDDNVWVIDSDNYMHKFVRDADYDEDTSEGFSIVDAFPPGVFQGRVFDFVINFHNKAFYILTDYHANGSLYRIECNGNYYSTYDGIAPNPLNGVLPGPHNGLADIVIDNFDELSQTLNGAQDCMLIIAGGNAEISPSEDSLFIARVNSDLANRQVSTRANGAQCITIDPIGDGEGDRLRVVHGSPEGRRLFSVHLPPVDW